MPGRHRLHILFVLSLLALASHPPTALADGFDDPAASTPDATVYSPTFLDVADDHLFAAEIRALFAEDITRGCIQMSTRFCPDEAVTRGAMAAFLTRALDLPAGQSTDFTDDNGHTFANDINRIAAAGITRGCNPPANTRFCPDLLVTRGAMAAFLTRALDLPAGQSTDFTDDNGHTFENDINRIAAAGITRGCNPPANTRFCPDLLVTRGAMAAFLTRALDLPVPPALPAGVHVEREPLTGTAVGSRVTVCRDSPMSLMVRMVVGDQGVGDLSDWVPTHSDVPSGEVDLFTDRWFLPSGEGCETLQLAWDPRANTVEPPLAAIEVASPFGYRAHPILGGLRLHSGVDLYADAGDPVTASGDGVAVIAGITGGYGQLVEIKHPGGLATRYAHLSTIEVEVGEVVSSGDLLGLVGCTGLCTGPHLHFETREWDNPVDPMSYLN